MSETSATNQPPSPACSFPSWELPHREWVIAASVGTLLGLLVALVPALFVREPRIDVPPLPSAPPAVSHAPVIVSPWGAASGGSGILGLGDAVGEWGDDDNDDAPGASASAQAEPAPEWEATALISGIDKERAFKVLRRHYDSLDDCYQQYRGKPKGKTRLGIGFAVKGNGSVADIRILENSTHNRELQACVIEVFEQLRFRVESGSDGGNVSLRYVFE